MKNSKGTTSTANLNNYLQTMLLLRKKMIKNNKNNKVRAFFNEECHVNMDNDKRMPP